MRWHPFDKAKGYRQKRPEVRKYVLVALKDTPGGSIAIAVGYRKDAAGDKSCPYFVTPGVEGTAFAWAYFDLPPVMWREPLRLAEGGV